MKTQDRKLGRRSKQEHCLYMCKNPNSNPESPRETQHCGERRQDGYQGLLTA